MERGAVHVFVCVCVCGGVCTYLHAGIRIKLGSITNSTLVFGMTKIPQYTSIRSYLNMWNSAFVKSPENELGVDLHVLEAWGFTTELCTHTSQIPPRRYIWCQQEMDTIHTNIYDIHTTLYQSMPTSSDVRWVDVIVYLCGGFWLMSCSVALTLPSLPAKRWNWERPNGPRLTGNTASNSFSERPSSSHTGLIWQGTVELWASFTCKERQYMGISYVLHNITSIRPTMLIRTE